MHYVNCANIDAETNYFMILIITFQSRTHIANRHQEVHSNYIFSRQIDIKINQTCRNKQRFKLY